jgi:hypothetical protein
MVAIQIGDRLLDSSDLGHCMLCGCWLPEEELLTITRGIRWCGPCAAPHPELVPPTVDVIWPIAGGLLGSAGGVLVVTALGTPDFSTSLAGMLGFLVGGVVGAGMRLLRPG